MVLSFKHFFAFFIMVVSEEGNGRMARVVENIVYFLFSFLLLLAILYNYFIFDLYYLLVNYKFKKLQKWAHFHEKKITTLSRYKARAPRAS